MEDGYIQYLVNVLTFYVYIMYGKFLNFFLNFPEIVRSIYDYKLIHYESPSLSLAIGLYCFTVCCGFDEYLERMVESQSNVNSFYHRKPASFQNRNKFL